MSSLTHLQMEALRLYGRSYMAAHRADNPRAYTYAMEDLRQARARLTPPQRAISDLVGGKGRTISELSELTQQRPSALVRILVEAAVELARHYEASS